MTSRLNNVRTSSSENNNDNNNTHSKTVNNLNSPTGQNLLSVNNNSSISNSSICSSNNHDNSFFGPGHDPKRRPNLSSSTASNNSNYKTTSQKSDGNIINSSNGSSGLGASSSSGTSSDQSSAESASPTNNNENSNSNSSSSTAPTVLTTNQINPNALADFQSLNCQQLELHSTNTPQTDHLSNSLLLSDQSSRPQMIQNCSNNSHLLSDQSSRPQMIQNNSNQIIIQSPDKPTTDSTSNSHQILDQSFRPQMVYSTNNSHSQSSRPQMAETFTNIQEILKIGATTCQSFDDIEMYARQYFAYLIQNYDWLKISERAKECTHQFYSVDLQKSIVNAKFIIDNADVSTSAFKKENFKPFIDDIKWFDQDQVLNLDDLLSLPSVDLEKCDLKNVYADYMAGSKFSVISKSLRKDICTLVKPYYDELDFFDRKIIEKLIMGFSENINYELIDSLGTKNFIEKPNRRDNTKILQYLNSESSLNRVRKVDLSGIPRFSNGTFYSCRIIPVDEIKVKNGVSYHRDRFVINAVKSNELVLPPFTLQNEAPPPKYFTTPSPEILFLHDQLFFDLLSSKHVTIYDRQSFYRQWKTSPSFWPASIQTSFNNNGDLEYWVDVCGRMGNKYSAHVAQGIVTVIDKIFSLAQNESVCITNQDDSIILKSTPQSALLYRQINEKLGFTFNETKTQFQISEEATWCGYTFNLKTKTIKIKRKRLTKFEAKLEEILSSKYVSRRDFARLIGMIWSSRLLFFGRRVLLNPALYFVRKTSKIFKNYVNEVELKKKEWDHKVETNQLLINELLSCAEVMRSEIPLWNVRLGFKKYLKLQQKLLSTKVHHIQIHTDASLSKAGVGILLNGKAYSFRYKFCQQYLDQSINFKEFFAVLLGYFMAIIFRYLYLPNKAQVNFLFLIDNTCAENIALSRKAAAKNAELSLLSKCLCSLERCFEDCVVDFCRIKTDDNNWADSISRSDHNQVDIECISCLLDAISFMLGSKTSIQSNLIKKLIPKWLGPPANPPQNALPNPTLTLNQSSQ